jgi:enolase
MNMFEKLFLATAVGDEGGFAPNFQDNKEGNCKN